MAVVLFVFLAFRTFRAPDFHDAIVPYRGRDVFYQQQVCPGPWFDPEGMRDRAPSSPSVFPVTLDDLFDGLAGHPDQLQDHEGVRRPRFFFVDQKKDVIRGNIVRGAEIGNEHVEFVPGGDVHVSRKGVEIAVARGGVELRV